MSNTIIGLRNGGGGDVVPLGIHEPSWIRSCRRLFYDSRFTLTMLNKYCNIVKHISQNSRFLSLCSIRNNEAHTNGTFNKGQTHFGFQTVSENEKESRGTVYYRSFWLP